MIAGYPLKWSRNPERILCRFLEDPERIFKESYGIFSKLFKILLRNSNWHSLNFLNSTIQEWHAASTNILHFGIKSSTRKWYAYFKTVPFNSFYWNKCSIVIHNIKVFYQTGDHSSRLRLVGDIHLYLHSLKINDTVRSKFKLQGQIK